MAPTLSHHMIRRRCTMKKTTALAIVSVAA
jgi:hypothetical protein